jgi:phosphatidylserine/phosphatidylglycerophosphate/cardiolipin synthase-like enzyme
MRDMGKINASSIDLFRNAEQGLVLTPRKINLRFHPPLHTKLTVTDNGVMFGSGNLTNKSFFGDDNLFTFPQDPALYEEYLEAAKEYYEKSIPEETFSLMNNVPTAELSADKKDELEKEIKYVRKLVQLYSLL